MGESIKIMLVEDSTTQALILKRMLETQDYTVTLASSAEQALELLASQKPDLILSDINLPEMDGYELTQKIKSDPRLQNTLVVLFASLLSKDDIFLMLECGADNFIFKTYDDKYIHGRLADIIQTASLREDGQPGRGCPVVYGGEKRQFPNTDQGRIIDLLLSSFETNVHQRKSLKKAPV